MSKPVWLRTDEIEEFIGALEHAAVLAERLVGDATNWKWTIVALHNALQGAFVCALRGNDTAGITMLTTKSGAAVWRWLNIESRLDPPPPMPPERLAGMLDLYDRVQDLQYLPDPHRLPSNAKQTWSIKRLNSLRNDLIHFVPRGLSVDLRGMADIANHCCDVIEHLAVAQPTFSHHMSPSRRDRISRSLEKLRSAVADWATSMNQ